MDEYLSQKTNPFSFSDGTEFSDSEPSMLLKWACGKPDYTAASEKCAYLYSDGRLAHDKCGYEGWALCNVACKDASSGSELSRANLPVFALFAMASVFKAVFALVGPDF